MGCGSRCQQANEELGFVLEKKLFLLRGRKKVSEINHIAVSDVFDMGRRDRYRLTEYGPSAPGR
jgi:hypothetical protein